MKNHTHLRRGRLIAAAVLTSVLALGASLLVPSAALAADASITPGASRTVDLGSAPDRAAVEFDLDVSDVASGAAYVATRVRVSGAGYYSMQARIDSTGDVRLSLKRIVGGVVTDLVPAAPVDLAINADDLRFTLALSAGGTDSVALKGSIIHAGRVASLAFTDSSEARISSGTSSEAWTYLSRGAAGSLDVTTTALSFDASSRAVAPGKSARWQLVATDAAAAEFSLAPAYAAPLYLGIRVRESAGSYYLFQSAINKAGRIAVTLKRHTPTGTVNLVGPVDSGLKAVDGAVASLELVAQDQASEVELTGTLTIGGKSMTIGASPSSPLPAGRSAAWAYLSSGASGSALVFSVAESDVHVAEPVPTPEPTPVPEPTPTPEVTPAPEPTPDVEPGTAPKPGTPPVQTKYPDASSTGVPAGTVLTVHEGDLTITTAGTVIDGLEVRGIVKIQAPGVVIRNSLILGREGSKTAAVSNYPNGHAFVIEDSEVTASAPSVYANGIMGSNFTARRVNVHDVIDPIRITGSNVQVLDSYLHSNLHYLVDPTHGNTPSHDDSIQIQGGSGILIRGNTMTGAHNAAIQITQGLAPVSDVTIDANHLQGGSCTVNISQTPLGAMAGIAVTSNVFGPERFIAKCAVLAPRTSSVNLRGNTWEATGGAVSLIQK